MTLDDFALPLFGTGFVWAVFCIRMSFKKATHDVVRPWAGMQQRSRQRKDGTRYVQTYYSKGQAARKTTLDKRWSRLSLIGTIAMVDSFFL